MTVIKQHIQIMSLMYKIERKKKQKNNYCSVDLFETGKNL